MKFKAIKTKEEYELMKVDMSLEIDNFLSKFNDFINSTSPHTKNIISNEIY